MTHHLVIPAAGKGQRFGGPIAKQYLDLCGAPIIERTLESLLELFEFSSVSVGLAPADKGWQSRHQWRRIDGGASRAETVLNILNSLEGTAEDNDWVWVHDAVRPFLSSDMVEAITRATMNSGDCFVVGIPAVDTLKLVGADGLVNQTLDRSRVWLAQTPQVCRYALLRQALQSALSQGVAITDEASAMELCGFQVHMIQGSEENIKITRPGDLRLAQSIYQERTGE